MSDHPIKKLKGLPWEDILDFMDQLVERDGVDDEELVIMAADFLDDIIPSGPLELVDGFLIESALRILWKSQTPEAKAARAARRAEREERRKARRAARQERRQARRQARRNSRS
jgi:hypothetical protein